MVAWLYVATFVRDSRSSSRETLTLLRVNNKGEDQAFLIRLLERIIYKLDSCKMTIFWLVYVDEQIILCFTKLKTPNQDFSRLYPYVLSDSNMSPARSFEQLLETK